MAQRFSSGPLTANEAQSLTRIAEMLERYPSRISVSGSLIEPVQVQNGVQILKTRKIGLPFWAEITEMATSGVSPVSGSDVALNSYVYSWIRRSQLQESVWTNSDASGDLNARQALPVGATEAPVDVGTLVLMFPSSSNVGTYEFYIPITSNGSGTGSGSGTGDGSGTGTASSGGSGTGTATATGSGTATGTGVGTTIEFITDICPIFEDDDCCDGGGGTVTSVGAQFTGDGMTIVGSPITDSGTLQFALDDDLAALEALTGTGIPWRTGADAWAMASNIIYSTGDTLTINTPSDSNIPLIINAAVGQLASLTEWRRSDTGAVLMRVVGTITDNTVSLDIGQGYASGIAGGSIQINVSGVKAGIRRGGVDHFVYYDLSSGDTVLAQIFGSGRVSLRGQSGVERVGVNSTGLSFYGGTPVAQPNAVGETVGFTAGSGTTVRDGSTFTGNVGTRAYRINDIVKALKNLGLIASN